MTVSGTKHVSIMGIPAKHLFYFVERLPKLSTFLHAVLSCSGDGVYFLGELCSACSVLCP